VKYLDEYRDAAGQLRKVPGFKDRKATEQRAAELERHAERKPVSIEINSKSCLLKQKN